MAKNLAKLYSSVLWKIDKLVSDELRYVTKISKENIKGVSWFLPAAYSI